jgi:mycothiol synthase
MTIRAFEQQDMQAVCRLLRESLSMESISETKFVRQVLLDPNFDPQGAPVAELDGTVAGFALAIVRRFPLEDAPPDFDRAYLTLMTVAPEYRRQGVGSQLLQHVETLSRQRGAQSILVSPYSPNYFIPGVDVDIYPGMLAFLLAHGYQEVYRPLAMQVDLWHFTSPPEVLQKEERLMQQGILIEPYRPDWTLPLLEFLKRDFVGDWQRFTREGIHKILSGDLSVQMWLAHDDKDVLGFVRHEGERYGPVGVAPKARGKGIAQVLTLHCLEGQKARGYRTAYFLWSDDTTAAQLYNRFGFQVFRRYALMKKVLPTSEG